MHEMSLCESIVGVLEAAAREQQFSRVRRVRLTVGALAGVELTALRFGFEVVSRDTLADGATLEILPRPGQAYCFQCGDTVSIQQRFDPCPGCGGHRLQVTGGDELKIKDLEVE